jgi:hypothetical protein
MKKQRRKKPKEPKSTIQSKEKMTEPNNPKSAPPAELLAIKERPPKGLWFWWKETWAFLGPIVALAGFAYLWMPQISIEPSVNLDPSQPLATQVWQT